MEMAAILLANMDPNAFSRATLLGSYPITNMEENMKKATESEKEKKPCM